MSRARNKDIPEGYGKLLEQWEAPEGAGDPVGCVATTFSFSPAFFEEECLSRFIKLETDAAEDGPLYLVEREEKLAQVVCAAVLVDQHNCKGTRSLRWDLHPARISGILHAKISLLCWAHWIRLIVGSANLTEDGYRRNQEVFGVLDYYDRSESPNHVLTDTIAYLREVMRASQTGEGNSAAKRWDAFLDRVQGKAAAWQESAGEHGRRQLRVSALLTGPGKADVFMQLGDIWPAGSPPHTAKVLSPFFDPPGAENRPAKAIWKAVRKRGSAVVSYCLDMEELPDEKMLLARAPSTLGSIKPPRDSARVVLRRVKTEPDRPLHAKELLFEDDRFVLLMVGSSNFTSAGMGLGKTVNYEANLVYILDKKKRGGDRGYKDLAKRFPESAAVDSVRFGPACDDQDSPAETVLLPPGFKSATYRLRDENVGELVLELGNDLPAHWQLFSDDEKLWQDAAVWETAGKPSHWIVPWTSLAPSGILVTWPGAQGKAWWPVNVESSSDLPPPEELKELPLEILINLLTSARPLHEVLRRYLRRHDNGNAVLDTSYKDADPHKRVDTSGFLLQRTRRFSWALNSLRIRLERPVTTEECLLNWRIHGPVGVMAVANALKREAKSTEERLFLVAELALELARVNPEDAHGYLPASRVREVLLETARALCDGGSLRERSINKHLQVYLNSITAHIAGQMTGA